MLKIMSHNKCRFINYFLLFCFLKIVNSQTVGLGSIKTNVPWRSGHASGFYTPYVFVYGGSKDTESTISTIGSSDLWIYDTRNGSWYEPTIQVQGGVSMMPQIYFKATVLPTQGQFLIFATNTTNGSTTNVIQKLDINSWSWSFPTSNLQSNYRTIGNTLITIGDTVYNYGGISVDSLGLPVTGSVQNTLSVMNVNNYQWSSISNGLSFTDHTTCYVKACNCLISFGGTSSGIATDVTNSVSIYNLTSQTWNVQGIQTAPGSSIPGARRLHTANCLDDSMIIYGGGTDQPIDTDVWLLTVNNLSNFSWKQITMNNQSQSPGLRMGHSAVLDELNKKIYIYGGWGVSATNDSNMYILDANTWSWSRVAPAGYANGTTNANNPSSSSTDGSSGASNKSNAGTIAGAVVGGVVGLGLIIAAIAFFLIRNRKKNKYKKKETIVGEVIDEDDTRDNPFAYNPGGYYSTRDDDDSDDDQGFYLTDKRKRVSKAFHSIPSTSNRRSELGGSEKIVTGVLEALDSQDIGTTAAAAAATLGSHSPHHSARNSKVLLIPPPELVGQGQVPNEIVVQKPNQFSVPAVRHVYNQHVPIEHHRDLNSPVSPISPTSATSQHFRFNPLNSTQPSTLDHPLRQQSDYQNTQPSTSLDVVRSIKTTGSSMMNHTGNSQINESRSKDGVPVTHTYASKPTDEDEENWTFADSLSVNHHYTTETTPPIQYIVPTSNQMSVANSTQTWDTKDTQQRQAPLVHHHLQPQQYPSSTLNMPLAQAVTPPLTTNNSSKNNSANTNELRDTHVNVYNAVSPLDALASLGQPEQTTPGSSYHGSSNLTEPNPSTDKFAPLAPLISSLPRKYQVDKTKAPVLGPTNHILFATLGERPVAIKAFGRREAWERECRNLIKLKSSSVVEILEVLTIQQARPSQELQEEDDGVRYVIVMERLSETLSSFIRHKRPGSIRKIARDILSCLSWCHTNGIAFCDLKPSNIMHHLDQDWKLIDFEASRTIDEECVGVITPRYCPPEVARATTYGLEGANGVVATASVDLWSLGCVIYEMETKKALFPSNMKDETILHFISHPSPSTPILNNGLRWNDQKELEIPQLEILIPNSHTRQVIKSLLSRDPSKRGSATQLLEDPYFSK